MNEIEIAEKLAVLEQKTKHNEEEIHELKIIINEIHNISNTLATLTEQMTRTSADVKDLKKEMNVIKDKPGEKWEHITKAILTAVIGGLIALTISLIFK